MSTTGKNTMTHPLTSVPRSGVHSWRFSQNIPPFGLDDDSAYLAAIWGKMTAMNLAGASQIHVAPYQGTDPHGMILAGTVAKGVDVGCTSCPMHAGGNDDVFTADGTAATVEQKRKAGRPVAAALYLRFDFHFRARIVSILAFPDPHGFLDPRV